jgi:hypothetical protein
MLSGLPGFAAVYDSDGSEENVRTLLRSAHDGDTITLPAGTFSWTSTLEITKGVTLQGATTIENAGTNNPSVTDATIVADDIPRKSSGAGIIKVAIRPGQSFRMTGCTFVPGESTQMGGGNGAIHLLSRGSSACTSMRIDHCHFASLYQGKLMWVSGWVYGVADHNVIECRGNSFPFFVCHDAYGGASQKNGNGSWADYPWYGTEKFFFIEDNTVTRPNARKANSLVDTFTGGRWVARHNYLENVIPSGHGTEGGAGRGQRVSEFYNNTVNITVPWSGGGQRSGTSLWHDNIFSGREPNNGNHCNLPNFRETPARAYPIWGIADGTSPWDVNDTEGNGTAIEGHAPHLFDSGAATADTTINGSRGTLVDWTKNWAPNRWAGYSIKNTSRGSASYSLGSYVVSNTSNTITYHYYREADTRAHLVFKAGDTYEIHRVLTMMDQNGRGKGDQISGNLPMNAVARKRVWPHQALEPCYSWNNIYVPSGHALGFGSGSPTTLANRDYFNLGGRFAWDTTPSEVSARYTAGLNGVDYVGPFLYPHPLVKGAPTPSTAGMQSFPAPLLNDRKKSEANRPATKGRKKVQRDVTNEAVQRP